MTTDDPTSRGFSLKRWSQRKLEAARAASAASSEAAPSTGKAALPADSTPSPLPPATASAAEATAAAPALPAIDSLTIDSDFSAFLGSKVDPAIKLQALKKLFRDPRFNVMDGLDVYIDDYSIPDPLEPEIARTLAHARYVFDPPRTRVNEAGIVEDVPADEASIDARALPPGATPPPDATSSSDAASLSDATSSSDAPPSPLRPSVPSESAAAPVAREGEPREAIEPTRR